MGRGLIAAVVAFFLPAYAFAAGPYVSLSGGAVFLEDSDLEADNLGLSGEAEFDTGFVVSGAAGYAFDAFGSATVRVEAEVAYRQNDVDTITVTGVGTGSGGDAEVSVLSGMANLAVDILTWSIVKPYVLVGIGVANVTLESDDLDVDEDDTVFAYQAGAGLGFAVTETITLFAGYRYFATADPEFEGVDAEYHSHNIEAGVRFEF
jgi:opacity protein-like surface antigen